MKRKIKVLKLSRILSVFLLMFLISSSVVFGQEKLQSAGNQIYAGSSDNITGSIERDVYSFTRITDIDGSNIGRSAVIAAQNVNIKNSTIGDSLRSVSQTLNISQTIIDNNITAGAESISIDNGTVCNAVYGFANNMDTLGTTNYLFFYGDTITIGGNIKGDAKVTANNVVVKSDALIEGTLEVISENQPVVEDGATIGNINIDLQEKEPEESIGEKITGELVSIGYWIVATIIIGMLMIMFANPAIDQAAFLIKNSPLPFFLCGFLGLILTPIALLILLIPFVTIPSSVVLLTIYGICLGISVPFTSLTLSRLILPEMNKWLSGLIFLVILALLSRIKFIGWLVLLVSHVFIIGYVILALYVNMKESFKSN